jgi:hypothetical protein
MLDALSPANVLSLKLADKLVEAGQLRPELSTLPPSRRDAMFIEGLAMKRLQLQRSEMSYRRVIQRRYYAPPELI